MDTKKNEINRVYFIFFYFYINEYILFSDHDEIADSLYTREWY